MKKEEIDKLNAGSPGRDEAGFYENPDQEEDVFEMWWHIYKGRNAWVAVYLSIIMLLFSVIAVYCGYYVFTADSLVAILRYGTVMFLAVISVGMVKIWFLQQMDRNAILREMKRMENQLAVLLEKVTEK